MEVLETTNVYSNNITSKTVAWAARHDWFLYNVMIDSGLSKVIVRDDMLASGQQEFTSRELLIEWAGY